MGQVKRSKMYRKGPRGGKPCNNTLAGYNFRTLFFGRTFVVKDADTLLDGSPEAIRILEQARVCYDQNYAKKEEKTDE